MILSNGATMYVSASSACRALLDMGSDHEDDVWCCRCQRSGSGWRKWWATSMRRSWAAWAPSWPQVRSHDRHADHLTALQDITALPLHCNYMLSCMHKALLGLTQLPPVYRTCLKVYRMSAVIVGSVLAEDGGPRDFLTAFANCSCHLAGTSCLQDSLLLIG